MTDRQRRCPEEQFSSLSTQTHAARFGMWIFLGSETLLFAALFALYLAYRILYSHDFVTGLSHNNQLLGTLNTLVLITSSFTVALAIDAARSGHRRRVTWLLVATLLMAVAFLVIKGYEYWSHFEHGIYPGAYFSNEELDTRGTKLFFTLYFFMTGLHALHVVGGMVAIAIVAILHHRSAYTDEYYLPLDLTALYWHLVDAVWIFLWPLFYLLK